MDFAERFPRGWHVRGQRWMDLEERWHSIDLTPSGMIAIKQPPGLTPLAASEQAACDAVISKLNCRGGSWHASEATPKGDLEMGIDRFARARTVTDRHRGASDRLNMQVTKIVADAGVCQALSKAGPGSVDFTMEDAVSAMRASMGKKAWNPAGPKDHIVLVLDAMEIPLGALDPVITLFRRQHGEWARSLGFGAIWVAARENGSFPLI